MPTARQALFLTVPVREALYGGAAGGGKSDALLMAALQYVDVPGYAAAIFRRTYADLSLPGAIMSRAEEWLANSGAKWDEQRKTFTFPSSATLSFGYLQTEVDKYRYQGAEFQFIGFDEVTQFGESQYRYLFSRLRRLQGVNIPIRMRAASNPGGIGHEWVKQRFLVEGKSQGRLFIPAKLQDNPYLDATEYRQSLQELDPVTREQLLQGNWDILLAGNFFKRNWFKVVAAVPEHSTFVRYWDKAGTEGGTGARSAGVLLARTPDKRYIVADVIKGRWSSGGREAVIQQTAHLDKKQYGSVAIWIEQEPGSGGKESAENTVRNLAGFTIRAERVTGDKILRAGPLASQAEAGNVDILSGAWNREYLDELEAFPEAALKDQVDASSGAFNKLAESSETYQSRFR